MVQPGSRTLSPIARAALAAAYAAFGWLLLTSAWTLAIAHFPGLYVDMWDEMPFLQRLDEGQSSLHDWMNAYAGSHRLLLSRAVFAMEHTVFQHANVLTAIVSVIFQCAALILALLFLRRASLPLMMQRGLMALILAAGVSALHLYNVLYPFLVQWFQVLAFSLLAFGCLIATAHTGREKQGAALAWLFALLASFCNFPGVVAIFNLALLGIALRLTVRWPLAIACVLTVIAQGLSLPDADLDHHGAFEAVTNSADILLIYPLYLIRFLGTPLTPLSEPAGMLLGSAIFVYTAWHGLRWLWQGKPQSPAAAFALAGLMWLCGTAIAVMMGRALIPVTATTERFHTLHLWLVPLLCMHWAFSARSTRQRGALAVVMTAWFALLMYWQPIAIHNTLVNSQKVRMAHIAYTIGMTDWRTHPLLSIPHRAEKRNPALDWKPYLQSTGNGIFAQSASHWAGQYVIESARRLPACIGNVAMTPLDNGFSAVRIGITHGARPAAAWVLDEHQQVIGYALRALPGGLFDDTTALAGYSATVDQWTVIGNPEHAPCLLGQSL